MESINFNHKDDSHSIASSVVSDMRLASLPHSDRASSLNNLLLEDAVSNGNEELSGFCVQTEPAPVRADGQSKSACNSTSCQRGDNSCTGGHLQSNKLQVFNQTGSSNKPSTPSVTQATLDNGTISV